MFAKAEAHPSVFSFHNATVAAISNAGLNLAADVVMGRDIDWEQTLASLPVDFVFSLVSSGWSGGGGLWKSLPYR